MTNNDDEQFERIPWDQLRPTTGNRRGFMYALAAAIVAAAVSATLARNLSESPASPVPLVPTTTAATPALVPTTTSLSPTVWSEADLMAVSPENLAAEAAALAEWFVADYFTADGTDGLEDQLRLMLPSDVPLPVNEAGYRSFVDWVQALSVAEASPGEYAVHLVVRALGAADGASYLRLPVRAVEVVLRWTDEGWSIADLPSPIDLPALAVGSPWPEEDVPEDVSAEAVRVGGEGAKVIGGGRSGERWRVIVETIDLAGGRWPLVVWIDEPVPSG